MTSSADPATRRRESVGATALELSDLSFAYRHHGTKVPILAGVDLVLRVGQITGLVGESGSGKSTAALAAIGYPLPGGAITAGSVLLGDVDLRGQSRRDLRRLWGRRVVLVAQTAGASLNPARRLDAQLREPLQQHFGLGRREARRRALEALARVGISATKATLRAYPHQFSGGQQQRIALAIAIASDPEVVLLDEPTSGLDATTQREINDLLHELIRDSHTAALYISHDLSMLATIADSLAVMYAGEIVEVGWTTDVLDAPRHPYTAALLDAVPSIDSAGLARGIPGRPPPHVIEGRCPYEPRCPYAVPACGERHPELVVVQRSHRVRCIRTRELGGLPPARIATDVAADKPRTDAAILRIDQLVCTYRTRTRTVRALAGVSLGVTRGASLAIVGESGSGKSTLLRAVAGIKPWSSGSVELHGKPLQARIGDRSQAAKRAIQLVFQNPDASLNPRLTVEQIVARPMQLLGIPKTRDERRAEVLEWLERVRLDGSVVDRRPHQLSGGQRQRVAIACAFASRPEILLADEVVSALDVSVAASIVQLLAELVAETSTALVFVTHNIALARSFTHTTAVMKEGRIVELGATEELFARPQAAYTRTLLAAVPRYNQRLSSPSISNNIDARKPDDV